MHVKRKISLLYLLSWNIKPSFLLLLWSSLIAYINLNYQDFNINLPWLPISVIGIAVAFYLGFKTNASYDRLWEARKIWGAIVNDSRTCGAMIRDYISEEFGSGKNGTELNELRKTMIHRHIAWLYQLKRQLRVLKPWEHNNRKVQSIREHIRQHFPPTDRRKELSRYISEKEYGDIENRANPATQLLANQSADFVKLKKNKIIDEFRLMDLMKMISRLYDSQGKCERIKNYPFPRQYASYSYYLAVLFVGLVPLGLADAFAKFDDGRHFYFMIPLSVLIGLVFWVMELVGDYAENPFEGIRSDIPMDSLVRTIEIDLREMLDETDIPGTINPVDGILM